MINKNNKKIILFVFFAFIIFSAEKFIANAADECKSSNCGTSGMRECYCSSNSIASATADKRISGNSAKKLCCSQFKTACSQACKDGNYSSFVSIDPSYDKNSTNNALSQIPGVTVSEDAIKKSTKDASAGCCIKKGTTTSENTCLETNNTRDTTAAACRSNGYTFVKGDCATHATCKIIIKANEGSNGTSSTAADGSIPGTALGGGIVSCGRSGGTMCTLCDLIKGISDIITYLMKIAIGVAVLAICIGGVLYVVSAGEPGLVEMGKNAMKNALIGFVITLAAFLIIETLILYMGAQSDLGISVDWKTFSVDCTKKSSE